MSDDENSQHATWSQDTSQSLDDALKAGIFPDLVVKLNRISAEDAQVGYSNFEEFQEDSEQSESLDDLVRKGNEGLNKRQRHTCCFCRKVFTTRTSLKGHIQSLHRQSTKKLCDLCPKHFFSRKSLVQHFESVHSSKTFACNICGYKSSVKARLRNHLASHVKQIKCPICKKLVKSLKEHMRMHKPKQKCPICNKKIRKDNLQRHLKLHAGKDKK